MTERSAGELRKFQATSRHYLLRRLACKRCSNDRDGVEQWQTLSSTSMKIIKKYDKSQRKNFSPTTHMWQIIKILLIVWGTCITCECDVTYVRHPGELGMPLNCWPLYTRYAVKNMQIILATDWNTFYFHLQFVHECSIALVSNILCKRVFSEGYAWRQLSSKIIDIMTIIDYCNIYNLWSSWYAGGYLPYRNRSSQTEFDRDLLELKLRFYDLDAVVFLCYTVWHATCIFR